MPLNGPHLKIAVVGVLLPYVARLPKGVEWVQQYTNTGLLGNLFLGILNAIPWGCMIAASSAFRNTKLVLVPCAFGFGVLAWGHYTLNLHSNANAPIALVIIPFYATVAVGIGTAVGLAIDRLVTRRDA
jgi:hypothetical protein